jgi:3-hydroxyisobutyrate dehydrogenase-like beta-hydroxyacid dehydrogenase
MGSQNEQMTIGILYAGELGSTFGRQLVGNGFRVVSTLEGRSARTGRLCQEAGLTVLDSVGRVLECSEVVISFVPPAAALDLARNVAGLLQRASRKLVYVDANSISPPTAIKIAEVLDLENVDFVDAAIRGLASQFKQAGVLYLSGTRAAELASLFQSTIRVKVVGDTPGQASALKMVLSGLPKGLIGLFTETMLFARTMGLHDEAMEICNEFYAGVMEVVARMLPTYVQHAARRSEELRELEEAMLLNGVAPRVVAAARQVTADLAEIEWAEGADESRWEIAEMMNRIYENHILHAPKQQAAVVGRAL